MDILELRSQLFVPEPDDVSPDHPIEVVDIFINETRLLDLIRAIELPYAEAEGHPETAGEYCGYPREALRSPKNGIWAIPDPCSGAPERVSFFGCSCGIWGCWDITGSVSETDTTIVWSDFRQSHRRKWSYKGLGPFTFDRAQYFRALQSL